MTYNEFSLGAMRRWVLLIAVPALLLSGCSTDSPPSPKTLAKKNTGPSPAVPQFQRARDATKKLSSIQFTPVAKAAGVDFTYYGGPSPERYMTEQNGGGVALLDFDGDGQLDIFFANGSHFARPAEQCGASHQLYRATGKLTYVEVSGPARLNDFGFGMGCAVGDYDNDGFADLFLAQYGKNRLWHNNGDGTFADVTDATGLTDNRWGTSAAFADLDGDGNLDLYVVNYVEWSPDDAPCYTQHPTPIHISCGPIGRPGQPDLLYHNSGDGMFSDVSKVAGIVRAESKGLGLAVADFDSDGWLDIYVANDTTENFLFRNRRGMRFDEAGIASGVAVGADGLAHSGMGVACADVDGDGRFDLFVTNFDNEVNDLYLNLVGTGFLNVNQAFGLDLVSRPMLGFGTLFSDFDADGDPDLFVANGHIWDLTPLQLHYAYRMKQQVLCNDQGQRFADTSSAAGPYFQIPRLGRAVAAGDLDDDGDDDLVVGHVESPAELLRNDSTRAQATCRLRFIGTRSVRQPLGCRVEVSSGQRHNTYWIPSGGGFQSSSDPEIVVVCDSSKAFDEVTIQWPGQEQETWRDVPVTPVVTLLQGEHPFP